MDKKILTEETIAQAVQNAAVDDKIYDKDSLEYALDRAYQANMAKKRREQAGQEPSGWINVLITGGAGIGKTARVKRWAQGRGLDFINQSAATMDQGDLGGAISPDRETGTYATRLGTREFDDLDFTPNDDRYKILFLDEFNRGDSRVRGTLLTLINNHTIPDPNAAHHQRYLPGFLFTVVAINPSGGDSMYNTDVLDAAERSRFLIVNMKATNKDSLDYLVKQYKGDLAVETDPEEAQRIKGRMELAKTILRSGEFTFDDEEEEILAQENQTNILNPRTLTQCLDMSDGTKDDFLYWFKMACNPTKVGIMSSILANYKDVQNKANDVFKKYKDGKEVKTAEPEEEPSASIFQKKEDSAWDKLQKYKTEHGI